MGIGDSKFMGTIEFEMLHLAPWKVKSDHFWPFGGCFCTCSLTPASPATCKLSGLYWDQIVASRVAP